MSSSSGSRPGAAESGPYSLELPPLSIPAVVPTGPDPAPVADARREPRNTVAVCRAVAVQLMDPAGQPCSHWYAGDILDLSLGGLCLLIHADGRLTLPDQTPLRLDVRSQPSFGVDVLQAQLRWVKNGAFGTTLGIAFAQPLRSLPTLS